MRKIRHTVHTLCTRALTHIQRSEMSRERSSGSIIRRPECSDYALFPAVPFFFIVSSHSFLPASVRLSCLRPLLIRPIREGFGMSTGPCRCAGEKRRKREISLDTREHACTRTHAPTQTSVLNARTHALTPKHSNHASPGLELHCRGGRRPTH